MLAFLSSAAGLSGSGRKFAHPFLVGGRTTLPVARQPSGRRHRSDLFHYLVRTVDSVGGSESSFRILLDALSCLGTRYWCRAFIDIWQTNRSGLSGSFGLIGVSLIVMVATLYNSRTPFPGLAATLPVAGTAHVIVWTQQRGVANGDDWKNFLCLVSLALATSGHRPSQRSPCP